MPPASTEPCWHLENASSSLEVRIFDPALSGLPTRQVRICQVLDLLSEIHAPERVLRYRHSMERGERFPPISVFPFLNRYVITDGHKRFHAYRGLGCAEIVVELWTLRRVVRDQIRQLVGSLTRTRRALSQGLRERRLGQAVITVVSDTSRHWKRIFRSMRRWS